MTTSNPHQHYYTDRVGGRHTYPRPFRLSDDPDPDPGPDDLDLSGIYEGWGFSDPDSEDED